MQHAASNRPTPITLVVADDHPVCVAGILRMAEHFGLRVVACCVDGRSALAAIVKHRPDVALLDVRMPGLSGQEVVRAVKRLGLPTKVLICSAHANAATVHALIQDGAKGFIQKTATIGEICVAVRRVAAGGTALSTELRARIVDAVAHGFRALSPRELECLRLVAEGLTDREIGLELHISHETVRTNLKRAQAKLGVSGRAALVREGMRRGLIE